MTPPGNEPESIGVRSGVFATTHWSVVLAAGQQESPPATEALEQLCRIYWYPLYAFVRREGYSPADAEDLTQAFFARLLEERSLGQVEPKKGKFRSFLLAVLRHFLSDQRDRDRAVKRGGGARQISLDATDAEERYRLEPVDRMDAEKIYEYRWVMTLLERALNRLRDENGASDKAYAFEHLKGLVAGDRDVSCAQVAIHMGLAESTTKSMLHRLRQRYHTLVREEIAQTVADPGEIDTEIQYLISVVCK